VSLVESSVSVTFSGSDPHLEIAMWPDDDAEFEVTKANGAPELIIRVGQLKVRLRPADPHAVDWCDITTACRLMAALTDYIGRLDNHFIYLSNYGR